MSSLPSVKDVLEWDGEDVWLLGASKVGDVGVKWDALHTVNIDLHAHQIEL